jgi:hypothetical protein
MLLILFEQEDWEEGACCVLSSPVLARFGLSLLGVGVAVDWTRGAL